MADNVDILPSDDVAAVAIATDQCTVNGVAGVHVPLGKIGFGPDGTYTPVTSSAGLPVALLASAAVIGAVTQSGSWTVTANAGTGTMAVSAASLPLPSGAATSAKQPALGTAGTPSADVLTVQGIASMTPLKVDASATTQPVSGTVAVSNFPGTQTVNGSVNVSGSALPTGAATSAKQDTEIASLANIDGKITACNTGSVTIASALPAGSNVIGGIAQSGSWTVTANAGSGTFAVSAASLPLPTGAATAANQATGNASLSSLDGKVSACNTGAVVISSALPAGTNLLGAVASGLKTEAIYSGTTALTPKFAVISASSSGATEIVAAVASKKIRVLKFTLSASAAVNIKFQSHTTPTDLTGLFYLAANSGVGGAFCPVGHFETLSGEALDINLSGAVAVGGVLTYIEV